MRATTALLTLSCLLLSGTARAEENFSLRNLNNQEISLSDYRGKVVLVNFWATWCAPCQVEMPHLQSMYTDLQDQGFEIVSVSVDDSRSKSKVKPLIKSKGYTFEVVLDTQTEVVSRYNPQKVLPYTFILDRDGEIVYRHQGYNPGDEEELRHKVEALLSGAAPAEDDAGEAPAE